MAKLYFRYGAMGSAKTMNLLAVAHNYEQQGKRVVLINPALDDRFGAEVIRSRAGLERNADICIHPDTLLKYDDFKGIDCIIVDECQFLSEFVIHQLRNITVDLDIPVICYGLRTNFMTRLFEGSRRLMEIADSIEEVKTTCAFCNRKAVFNIKLRHGSACTNGQEIELGAEDLYQPTCCRCFENRIGTDNPLRNKDSRTELWLVRHGETIENANGILSGQINAQLSPRGIEQAKALGINDDIIWHTEFVPDSEVRYFFGAADLIVQPYKTATQSGVTQIAYHFEKPMLVTCVGGLSEIVPNGKVGYAVNPDIDSISSAIKDFCVDNPDFHVGIIEEKKKYSWHVMCQKLQELCQK